MKRKQMSKSLKQKCKKVLVGALAIQMVIGSPLSTFAGENKVVVNEEVMETKSEVVLDSLWEVENPTDGNLKVNEDGSITITTERGDVTSSMNNVLYYKLPYATDSVFTVKVSGNMKSDFQAGQLMITSGKNLENAVGVMNRYHGYLGGNYGTNELMGVMTRRGNLSEYYEASEITGNEFYLRLQKQNGWITGFYAKEYSDDPNDWNQIIDPTKDNIGKVDKNNAYTAELSEMYVAIAASSGGTDNATEVTFSDLRVNGQPIAFTTNPSALSSVTISAEKKMEVNGTQTLKIEGADYEGNVITEFDSVTYASSDEEILTVDEKGVVTGRKNGIAVVTAEAVVNGIAKSASLEIQVGEVVAEETWNLKSPDKKTEITVNLMTGGSLRYSATQNGVENIGDSPLGLVTNLGDFSKGLVVKNVSEEKEINETYDVLTGKKDTYINHCKEQTLTFVKKDDPSVEFDLILRAYDDGTAYRYGVRTAESGEKLRITDEVSGLQLPSKANVYWMDYASTTWNYEGEYAFTTTEELKENATPSMPMLYEKDGVLTLFSEADLNGSYAGSMFTVRENGLLDISFAKSQSGAVETTAPFKSPWRAAITGTTEDIVENTMIENLSTPADYETYDFESWVEPGLSSWSWVANWGSGISDQSKKETHLKWIEFASEIGWKYYILDEGWNPGGRGHINGMYDWWPEVRDYAKEKGVKLWVWVHVSDIDTPEEREKHFSEWEKEGIVGVKPDFFDGEGQDRMKLYDDLYKDAAEHNLMLLVHGANKPTGEVRTWPNVYGREAIRGQEAGGITAEQYTLIPFIRAAVGPAEVTEEIRSKDFNKTTMGFQIALTALVEDGIHSMGSAPEVYRGIPEAMSYYKDYPDGWENTEFVNGEVGKYLSIARQAGSNWYASGISVKPRTMKIPCEFLREGEEYVALLYKENGRTDIDMEIIKGVTNKSVLTSDVLAGGGYALRFIPESEVDGITSIVPEKTEVTVEKGRTSEAVKVTLLPENAEFQDVVWKSENESIATVNDIGEIHGVSEGETTVVVASKLDENVKAEIKVTVEPEKYFLDKDVWTVLNPTENYIINNETSITITTERGVLGDADWKNMFAMDVPSGDEDFVITAKISGGLNANYQGGFVTVFDKANPDKPSLAVGRRYHRHLMGNHPQAFGVMSTQSSTDEFYCEDENYNEDAWVRIEKQGNKFVCSYSYDGKAWTEITDKGNERQVINDKLAESQNLCVGFYAGAGGANSAIDIQISDFTYNGVVIPVAIEQGKETANKTNLQALISYAQDAKKNPNYEYVVPVVKELLEKALTDAIAVDANEKATQKEVDEAYDTLLERVHLLDFTGNSESLQVLVDVADGKVESMYTAESWVPFAKALEDAKKVLANENALQEEIDEARDALQAAMDALVKKENADKAKLEKLVKDAEKYEAKLDEYIPATTEGFVAALKGARDILANDAATQEEVDAAYNALLQSIFGLREKPSKDKLEELLNKVEKMDLTQYSDKTAKAVQAAYDAALVVMNDENAEQGEVDAAVKALSKAIAAADAEASAGDVNGSKTSSSDKDNGKKAAKTGDVANAVVPMMAGFAAVLAVLFAKKRK